MTRQLIAAFPGNEPIADSLCQALDAERARLQVRRFPDGESYVRYESDVAGCDLVMVCTLDHPDAKFLPLIFAASAARNLGASSVGLVAPYLAYMR